jgi:predicted DNA-binding protein with PD1-like motif
MAEEEKLKQEVDKFVHQKCIKILLLHSKGKLQESRIAYKLKDKLIGIVEPLDY